MKALKITAGQGEGVNPRVAMIINYQSWGEAILGNPKSIEITLSLIREAAGCYNKTIENLQIKKDPQRLNKFPLRDRVALGPPCPSQLRSILEHRSLLGSNVQHYLLSLTRPCLAESVLSGSWFY